MKKTKRSTYADRRKVNGADRYGQVKDGQIQDVVAGTLLTYKVGKEAG